jgi:predicted dehydrogenase
MPVDLSPRRDPGLPIHGFPGSLEMVREFIECIERRRAEPRAGLGEGLASLRAVQAIERSLAADVPVVLAEA